MKKGHRRTNSQTIGLSRPFQTKLQRTLENQQLLFQHKFQPQIIKNPHQKYASIQSLLQKSENHIAQRVLYIQNLEQPNNVENTDNKFTFGKGINYKLSNFKLNMGEILEVPKSNQSTSLQGQNKIQILEKQLYFTHQPHENVTHTKLHKQAQKKPKFQPKHLKTSSAVGMKKINKTQKNQKTEMKNQIKSFRQIILKENPIKRAKLEYQMPKKFGVSVKDHSEGILNGSKNDKLISIDRFGLGDLKKKKNNLLK